MDLRQAEGRLVAQTSICNLEIVESRFDLTGVPRACNMGPYGLRVIQFLAGLAQMMFWFRGGGEKTHVSCTYVLYFTTAILELRQHYAAEISALQQDVHRVLHKSVVTDVSSLRPRIRVQKQRSELGTGLMIGC